MIIKAGTQNNRIRSESKGHLVQPLKAGKTPGRVFKAGKATWEQERNLSYTIVCTAVILPTLISDFKETRATAAIPSTF